jgi:hypothetical protein
MIGRSQPTWTVVPSCNPQRDMFACLVAAALLYTRALLHSLAMPHYSVASLYFVSVLAWGAVTDRSESCWEVCACVLCYSCCVCATNRHPHRLMLSSFCCVYT